MSLIKRLSFLSCNLLTLVIFKRSCNLGHDLQHCVNHGTYCEGSKPRHSRLIVVCRSNRAHVCIMMDYCWQGIIVPTKSKRQFLLKQIGSSACLHLHQGLHLCRTGVRIIWLAHKDYSLQGCQTQRHVHDVDATLLWTQQLEGGKMEKIYYCRDNSCVHSRFVLVVEGPCLSVVSLWCSPYLHTIQTTW